MDFWFVCFRAWFSLSLSLSFDEDVVDRDGISSTPLDIKKSNDSSSLMLTGRDTVGEIQ